MIALDLTLVIVVVAAAAAWLVWQLGLRKRAPACHPSHHKKRSPSGTHGGTNVVLDDKLARALARAQQRKRANARG